MNQRLLFVGGLLNLSLAIFKIAMPYLFRWQQAMSHNAGGMWAILYGENLGISLLLLFFAYMSIFQWQDLLYSKLGRSVTMSISALWVFRAIAELVLFRIGEDGAWWRFFLFLAIAGVYLIPLARSIRLNAVTG